MILSLPNTVIICGVSGVGKTTIGRALAERLGYTFLDADDFHSDANVEKMKSGLALNDEDRQPWLESLARTLQQRPPGAGVVLACSALKQSYRDTLNSAPTEPPRWVFLTATPDLILQRLNRRGAHFMPPDLLNSQLETLEPPAGAIEINVDRPLDTCLNIIEQRLAE